MPYIALHNGRKKPPRKVPEKTDVFCPTCGERMRVWRKGNDGTACHFKHIGNMGHGEGGNYEACESVAESDQHKVWKSFAADKIEAIFENNCMFCEMEKKLKAPYTDKKHRTADALLLFEDRDEQLGQGIAVEVQHKNTSKDIHGTTKDYIEQDIAVAWLDKDDFSQDGCLLQEIDFRRRAKMAVWPEHVPQNKTRHDQLSESDLINNYPFNHVTNVPAKLPPELVDDHRDKLKLEWSVASGTFNYDLVRELSENNANRPCENCGQPAEVYLLQRGVLSTFRCESHIPDPSELSDRPSA